MPISPISTANLQQIQQTSNAKPLITEVTVPKLDGSSKDPAYIDVEFEAAKAKPPVDLSGGAKSPQPVAETFVDGGITASDDWETPVV